MKPLKIAQLAGLALVLSTGACSEFRMDGNKVVGFSKEEVKEIEYPLHTKGKYEI